MLQLIVAFLLGALLSSVVLGILAALHQVLDRPHPGEARRHHLLDLGKLVGLIGLFKPKAAAPSSPPPPKPPPAAK